MMIFLPGILWKDGIGLDDLYGPFKFFDCTLELDNIK